MATRRFDSEWAEIFAEVQEHLRDWRREHPKATWREIEQETDRRLASLRAQMLADLATASDAAHFSKGAAAERPVCAKCRSPLHAQGCHTRRLRTHGDAEAALEREYAVCPTCGASFFPSGR